MEEYSEELPIWPVQGSAWWFTHNPDDRLLVEKPKARHRIFFGSVEMMFNGSSRDLESMIDSSQYHSAEALKYMIERTRLRRDVMGGLFNWMVSNPWPETSSCLADYTNHLLPGFWYTKQSLQEVLIVGEDYINWNQWFTADNNSFRERTITWKITRWRDGVVIGEGKTTIPAQKALKLCRIDSRFDVKEYYIAEWEDERGVKGINHYLSGTPSYDLDEYRRFYRDLRKKAALIGY